MSGADRAPARTATVGGHRELLACTRLRELEGVLHDPVGAVAREHRFLDNDLAIGAFEDASAEVRVFALGV